MEASWQEFYREHWRGAHETSDNRYMAFCAAAQSGRVRLDFHTVKHWIHDNVPISRKSFVDRITYNKTLIKKMASDRKFFDVMWKVGLDMHY